MPSNDIEQLCTRNTYLTGQNGDWRSYWQDVANFCLPRKAWITTMKIYGEQLKFNYLYDSRAILALKESAAGFHSKLTNPASKWFDFRTLDDKFMQSGVNQRYFRNCSQIQYGVLNDSNHNETMLEYYTDDLSFGSACVSTEEDYKTHVRYTSIPIEQVNVELDDRGELQSLYRNFKYTADQCMTKFKGKISPEMQDAIKDGKGYQKFDVMHYAGPRHIRDTAKQDNVNMPYRSLWIASKEKFTLAEGGFTSNPYEFSRFWVHAMDTFGYSPAMDALASIKLANAQKRTLIRRAMKDADQATAMPSRFFMGRFSQNPAAMNYYDKTKFSKEDFFTIPTGGNTELSVQMMEMEQQLIDRAFFLPLFRALTDQTKDMNVPEVQQRISESLSLVGPVVGRMTKGIANIQMRTFEILDRRLLFPPPPKELQGQDMKVIFLSPLAKAQRASEIQGLSAWLGLLGGVAKLIPDIIDNVDGDRIADGTADLYNVDPTYVREKMKVDAIRKATAQAKQQQMQLQQAQQVAETAQSGAQAKKFHAEANSK